MMSFTQNFQDFQSKTKSSNDILNEKENDCDKTEGSNESLVSLNEGEEVQHDPDALSLDEKCPEMNFTTEADTSVHEESIADDEASQRQMEVKSSQVKSDGMTVMYLDILKEIINQNKDEYLCRKGCSEIEAAFDNVYHSKGCNMNELKINELFEKIVKYTHVFPDDRKEEIQQFIKTIRTDMVEKYQFTEEPIYSRNTSGEIQSVNASQTVYIDSRGAPVNLKANYCEIHVNCNHVNINVRNKEPLVNDMTEMFVKKDSNILKASEGSITILVRFNSEKALNNFEEEYKKGITKNEIYTLLLKHEVIKPGDEINVTIKTGHGAQFFISTEEFEKLKEETIDLVPFMVAAYNCANLTQLDSRLASMFEKSIIAAGLESRYIIDQTINTGSSSKCLFPTFLHFAASYGLSMTYNILLGKPESKDALQMKNKYGKTPKDLRQTVSPYSFIRRAAIISVPPIPSKPKLTQQMKPRFKTQTRSGDQGLNKGRQSEKKINNDDR